MIIMNWKKVMNNHNNFQRHANSNASVITHVYNQQKLNFILLCSFEISYQIEKDEKLCDEFRWNDR